MNLKQRAEELLNRELDRVRLVTDTTQFMELGLGDVIELEGRRFVIRGVTYEGRFGLDEEPKHWVKTGLDMDDGSAKIIKLVFFERFKLPIGRFSISCYRSPRKEQRILDLTRGHQRFMRGETLFDQAGNPVRVLDRIPGPKMPDWLESRKVGHREYFDRHLVANLTEFIECLAALKHLHDLGYVHGDVRRDHLLLDQDLGIWRWIDFDYSYNLPENPFGLDLFGLGNVLCYLVGQGIPTLHGIKQDNPETLDRLDEGDLSLVIPNRVFNLRKIYPYLPESLNRVLLHFAAATPVYYERSGEILADLRAAMADLPGPAGTEKQ
jgi:hypothetical protein